MSLPKAGKEATRRTLRSLELRCPPLPETLADALALMDQPEKMEVGPITEIVQRDPIVVARLLHTANSAYYGLRQTISSADRAVVMLGPVAVAGIVLGMHMLKLRSILDGPAAACFQRLIRHSTATAFLTRHMLRDLDFDDHQPDSMPRGMGVSFTSGLLHDFGKIILVYNFPDEASELYDCERPSEAEANTPEDGRMTTDGRALERSLFGCDHTEAGEFAARKLNFPEELIAVIRHHHDPLRQSASPTVGRLVRITAGANLAAKALGYSVSDSHTPQDVADHPLWERLVDDLPQHGAAGALVKNVLNQKAHLDRYVRGLTASA